ncbi:MAG: phospho-N-acetylmuramoyl-pentapeptide-transferase, partial [Elusimicrobia bacterium]|nr:phospho-N-acetylmuramoyl-pentapeptide-transferase [Elusimicrobiota bacterium]
MLFYLSQFRDLSGAFNLFQYITFRAGGAALSALLISLLIGPRMIEALRKHKIGQVQRTDGPASHMGKQGTPTMGGLLIFATVVISTLLWMRPDNRFTWTLMAVVLALAAIGFWDDFLKLTRRSSAGVSSFGKFAVQVGTALGVVFYLAGWPPNWQFVTSINIPYGKELYLDLGPAYFVLAALMIVGSSNAVNLTDGLDGLAIGATLIAAAAFTALSYVSGHSIFANYLDLAFLAGAGELTIFCGAMVGAS